MLVTCDQVHFDQVHGAPAARRTCDPCDARDVRSPISSKTAVTSDTVRFDGVQTACDRDVNLRSSGYSTLARQDRTRSKAIVLGYYRRAHVEA